MANLGLYDGEKYQNVAQRGASAEYAKFLSERGLFRPPPGAGLARMIAERQPIHVADRRDSPEYRDRIPNTVALVELGGARTYIAVPMLKEGRVVGGIVIYRPEVRPFTQKQIDLVSTFANQAVIAIENVRLFQELQARTQEQARSVQQLTALGEVGRAVSSSLDLPTVLSTIVARAVELSGTDGGLIYEYNEVREEFHLRATHGVEDEIVELVQAAPIRVGEGATGRAAATRAPVQVADVLDEREYGFTRLRALLARLGYWSLLSVPLLLEQRIMGALAVLRKEAGSFSPEVVNLLQAFATQSALAIQNARLFRELEEKG